MVPPLAHSITMARWCDVRNTCKREEAGFTSCLTGCRRLEISKQH